MHNNTVYRSEGKQVCLYNVLCCVCATHNTILFITWHGHAPYEVTNDTYVYTMQHDVGLRSHNCTPNILFLLCEAD